MRRRRKCQERLGIALVPQMEVTNTVGFAVVKEGRIVCRPLSTSASMGRSAGKGTATSHPTNVRKSMISSRVTPAIDESQLSRN
jgi:hypothetical protein